jgi:hypothetical protein
LSGSLARVRPLTAHAGRFSPDARTFFGDTKLNPQDQDRIATAAIGASVTDINVFRANRGNVSVSTPYFSFAIGAGALFLALILVFFFLRR